MANGSFNSEQLAFLYQELDHECAELTRKHGHVTAAQRNMIAARLMEEAKENPPPRAPVPVSATGS